MMQSWICRFLSFVFLANVLFPVPVNSQNYLPKEVEKKLYAEMARQRLNYMQAIGNKANWDLHIKKLEQMPKSSFYSKDLVDVHLLIEKDLMDKVYHRAQIFSSKIQNSLLFPEDENRKQLEPKDLFRRPKFTGKRFLEILSAEGSFDFIEQWLDPYAIEGMYEPIVISYAAETVGAIIDTALRDRNQEEINFLLERLPLTQQHILYRIDYIEYMYGEIENMPQELMASLGSLRITIAEIRRFYQQIREKDPLSDRVTNPSVLYKNQSKKFLSEIEHFLSLDLEDGSALQQKAVIWVDYATTYFIKTGQYRKLEELVNLLDKSMDKTKFIQKGSPLLQSLFISIFENYVQMERNSKEITSLLFENYDQMERNSKETDIISLLKKFSDDDYSVTTRVLALETASNISRYFRRPSTIIDEKNRNINTNNSKEFSLIPDIRHKGKFVNGKFIAYMPYKDRVDFAKKVSKIYCPATEDAYLGYVSEDYGLESSQLAVFANKLAWIYDGFIDISTSVYSTPGSESYQANLGDCVVNLHNQPNKRMQDSENTFLFFRLVGETLLWVYAGEILLAGFRFIGTAYRSVRGVTLASPKIIKAAVEAQSGAAVVQGKKAVRKVASRSNKKVTKSKATKNRNGKNRASGSNTGTGQTPDAWTAGKAYERSNQGMAAVIKKLKEKDITPEELGKFFKDEKNQKLFNSLFKDDASRKIAKSMKNEELGKMIKKETAPLMKSSVASGMADEVNYVSLTLEKVATKGGSKIICKSHIEINLNKILPDGVQLTGGLGQKARTFKLKEGLRADELKKAIDSAEMGKDGTWTISFGKEKTKIRRPEYERLKEMAEGKSPIYIELGKNPEGALDTVRDDIAKIISESIEAKSGGLRYEIVRKDIRFGKHEKFSETTYQFFDIGKTRHYHFECEVRYRVDGVEYNSIYNVEIPISIKDSKLPKANIGTQHFSLFDNDEYNELFISSYFIKEFCKNGQYQNPLSCNNGRGFYFA